MTRIDRVAGQTAGSLNCETIGERNCLPLTPRHARPAFSLGIDPVGPSLTPIPPANSGRFKADIGLVQSALLPVLGSGFPCTLPSEVSPPVRYPDPGPRKMAVRLCRFCGLIPSRSGNIRAGTSAQTSKCVQTMKLTSGLNHTILSMSMASNECQ